MELKDYTVKTEEFEGPFDLLLDLIKKRKLFINDISLTRVTDAYLQHIRSLQDKPLPYTTSFLIIAATLILLKSKSLLPHMQLSDEEEHEIEDLEKRLRLYEVFQDVSQEIYNRYGTVALFPRKEAPAADPVFAPDERITVSAMHEMANDLIQKLPVQEDPAPEVSITRAITIEEMLDRIVERISTAGEIRFSQFSQSVAATTEGKEQKVYVIVSFLAMLELVRNGMMEVIQDSQTDDITLKKPDTYEQ